MQVGPNQVLDEAALAGIVHLKLDKTAERLGTQHTKLTYSDAFVDYLAASCTVTDSGARNIDHLLNRQILPALADSFLQWQ